MDEDFAVSSPLVRPGLPDIRFLFVRSRFCSTLLSDATSRRRPCASLTLHLHQVVQGTCSPKLSNMLGTQRIGVRDAGDYVTKYLRYPSPDDTDDHATVACEAACAELERQGVDALLWEGYVGAWERGYLGPRA